VLHVDLLDNGFVRLDGYMADDMSVVNSARVSFAQNEDDKAELTNADKGLINFLMRERHGTPFEHNSFRFHVKCPVFVAREWFRHRIGSFNEFSARYSEVPNEFFVPELSVIRTQTGKPGAYMFEQVDMEVAMRSKNSIHEAYKAAYKSYMEMINDGVAKELARVVLPVGMYTQFYWTVNARSIMNFCSLRSAETAQMEIRNYSIAVEEMFSSVMPVTAKAWLDNSRVAP
jgi:thymidylate synthase (FAD)